MTDNKLKKVSVILKFETISGYSAETSFKGEGNKAAIEAIDELARILAIEGNGQQALDAVQDAINRVSQFKAEQVAA